MKRLDCCLQGQGHSDGSKRHWIFGMQSYIFCPSDLFAMKLIVFMDGE